MNKTKKLNKKYEEILNYKIGKLRSNEKRKLYQHLKMYYHDSKKVSYHAVTKILFGESLFLRPQYPPLIGPGIVSNQKSLQFIVPKQRVEQIKNELTTPHSHFVLRFLSNEESQNEEEFKVKKTEKENQNNEDNQNEEEEEQVDFKDKGKGKMGMVFTINEKRFQYAIKKPFLIDLKLFDQEVNVINFETKNKNLQFVIVFQHMCKIDLNTIVNAVVQRKTIPEEQIKLLLPKYIESSTKNSKSKRFSNSNLIKIQKKFQIVSLECPLSNQRIQTPVRSKRCLHLQCFDLGNFLLRSEKTKKWCCPICRKQAKLEDLIIDGYTQKILQTNSLLNGSQIQIFCDGKYNLRVTNRQKNQLSFRQNTAFQGHTCNSVNKKNMLANKYDRKRDLLQMLQSQKDFLTNNLSVPQQQQNTKKKQKTLMKTNHQSKIDSTIVALRQLSNCKSIQSQIITFKK
ncbi:tonalli [Anaeramoeba flamelloides]|uniref:Tonalli n=1 Tax=Anaeramoeba flamelloides TaxID=1746091 RepID=A0ABQ8YUJ5_9EUKA|nr:tonalli [Anaeramoeba flamelloides]